MAHSPCIVNQELALRLEAFGATLIVGPERCGKTTTGEQKANSIRNRAEEVVMVEFITT